MWAVMLLIEPAKYRVKDSMAFFFKAGVGTRHVINNGRGLAGGSHCRPLKLTFFLSVGWLSLVTLKGAAGRSSPVHM